MDTGKDKPYMHIEVVSTARTCRIVVADNGIGIEPKHLNSIFDLFYRANASSKGTGIGLYIVKEAVSKLKGSIKVNSKFGEGSKFIVELKNVNPPKKNKITP
jgi:signal transduction histidine kinase